jgi:hypothetical protein
MEQNEFNALQILQGGIGCDLVTGTGSFKARKGKIRGVISNEDGSQIEMIREIRSNLGTSADIVDVTGASGLSYISKTDTTAASGGVDIDNSKWILFDNPVSHIQLRAGSFWVFYQNI